MRQMSKTGSARFLADAGNTLIEALVVVAITTMAAMIGFPKMQQGLLTLAQHQTVAVVAERLRQARAEALRRDGPVVFAVSADGRAYGATGGAVTASPAGISLALKSTPDGRIAFYGDGSSSGGVVWISDALGATGVTVGPLSGAVAVGAG
jgi:type II secretory pathway pseudopilin PulG